MTQASLKSRYRKTFAGFIWVVLAPLMMFGVQALVFKKFLRLDTSNYFVFLVSGLIPWIFISQSIQMGTPVLVGQSHLLRAFRISPFVFVSSSILDNFINFFVTFTLLLIPLSLMGSIPLDRLSFIPVLLVPLLIATWSMTFGLSIVNVFFRDTNFILGFIFSLLFFLTPIFYPEEFIPQNYRWMVAINPIHRLIDPFRKLLHGEGRWEWVVPFGWSCAVALMASLFVWGLWKRKMNDVYVRL